MEEGKIPRLIEFDEKSMIAAMVMTILSIPLRKADAIVIFTGEGEKQRVLHGVDLWRQGYGKLLLVTGDSEEIVKQFGGYTNREITQLCQVDEDHPDIFKGEEARHTLDQANWVSAFIGENPIGSLIVISALYHLPRVFLTLLKVLQKNNQRISLIPSPAQPLQLSHDYPLIPGEVERIIKYQERGDVATAEELCDYLH